MTTPATLISDLRKRMDKAIDAIAHDLRGLRAGRASASLLDPVVVEAYGSRMPLSQVATVTVPESKTLAVQVWDKTMVKAVEKAIANAELGVNPVSDGQLIRVSLPVLSEERRKELVKIAHKYAEQGKVAVRNIRRDGMDSLKKFEKEGAISKDEHHTMSDTAQKITDEYIKKIDDAVVVKEKEILQP